MPIKRLTKPVKLSHDKGNKPCTPCALPTSTRGNEVEADVGKSNPQSVLDSATSSVTASSANTPSWDLLELLREWTPTETERALILGPRASAGDLLGLLAFREPEWFFNESPWATASPIDILIDNGELDQAGRSSRRRSRRK